MSLFKNKFEVEEARREAEAARQEARDSLELLELLDEASLDTKGFDVVDMASTINEEDKVPNTEPEGTWIRDLDRMKRDIKSFYSLAKRHLKSCKHYDKYRSLPEERLVNRYLQVLVEYRPTLLRFLGVV